MAIRVLEVGDNVAAGYCGRLYAQLGAEVIRIDSPATPAVVSQLASASALDTYLRAGKRRIELAIMTPEGRDVLDQLATQCDLLITDVSPVALDELDWLSLGVAQKPPVKVSITPFGLSGPYRDWQASSAVLLAMGGYTALMGDPGRAPLTLPGRYVEYQSAQYAYTASLAVLRQRAEDAASPSPIIDVSMLETLLSLSQFTTVMWTYRGEVRRRHGNDWQSTHPLTLYPCKDGWFGVSAVPAFWEAFTRMLGRPDLIDDPRFATNDDRLQHRANSMPSLQNRLGSSRWQKSLTRDSANVGYR